MIVGAVWLDLDGLLPLTSQEAFEAAGFALVGGLSNDMW
jgi:hypothetical protein